MPYDSTQEVKVPLNKQQLQPADTKSRLLVHVATYPLTIGKTFHFIAQEVAKRTQALLVSLSSHNSKISKRLCVLVHGLIEILEQQTKEQVARHHHGTVSRTGHQSLSSRQELHTPGKY
jgi:hypothetical protein